LAINERKHHMKTICKHLKSKILHVSNSTHIVPQNSFQFQLKGTEASLPSNGQFIFLHSYVHSHSNHMTHQWYSHLLYFIVSIFALCFFRNYPHWWERTPIPNGSKVNLIVHINIQSACNHSLDRAKAAFNCTGKSN